MELSRISLVGNSKIGRTIRSANISELCDRLMQVASIPDRLPAVGDGHDESHENFMDIRKLAILLYGLKSVWTYIMIKSNGVRRNRLTWTRHLLTCLMEENSQDPAT